MSELPHRWRECAITLTWDPERQHTTVEAAFAIWHKGEPFVTHVEARSVGVLLGIGGVLAELDEIVQAYWDRVNRP